MISAFTINLFPSRNHLHPGLCPMSHMRPLPATWPCIPLTSLVRPDLDCSARQTRFPLQPHIPSVATSAAKSIYPASCSGCKIRPTSALHPTPSPTSFQTVRTKIWTHAIWTILISWQNHRQPWESLVNHTAGICLPATGFVPTRLNPLVNQPQSRRPSHLHSLSQTLNHSASTTFLIPKSRKPRIRTTCSGVLTHELCPQSSQPILCPRPPWDCRLTWAIITMYSQNEFQGLSKVWPQIRMSRQTSHCKYSSSLSPESALIVMIFQFCGQDH